MANAVHLQATLDAVLAHPEHWDQKYWHCGTTHCFAGFAEMLRLGENVSEKCPMAKYSRDEDAAGLVGHEETRLWLGLSVTDWSSITHAYNSLETLKERVCEVIQRSKETTE
jgi:hypothetical protein